MEKDIIAIYGKNGSGKTNILEAVSMLYPGKGLRGAKLADLSHFDGASQLPWAVFADVEGKQGQVDIGTAINVDSLATTDTRIVKIDGDKQRSQNVLSEHLAIFSLTPAKDQTFADGTTSRRELLDQITNFFYPTYNSIIGAFNNLKSQRGKLLFLRSYDHNWMLSIEQSMAEKAVAISHLRNDAVVNLNKAIKAATEYGFPSGQISILGDLENFVITNPQDDAEGFYLNLLNESRQHDMNSGRTNKGPHKSDFRVVHSVKQMPAELCSQGEQKAMLLSLTIATIIAKKSFSGVTPILLLDEVYAHLDNEKRGQLYNFISNVNCQTWLTGTEKESFADLEKCQFVGL